MASKGQKFKFYMKEEKLKIVKEMLELKLSLPQAAKKYGIHQSILGRWRKAYLELGEKGLENKKKPGNPLCKYSNKKNLSEIEELQYENMKLRIELERLKKGYLVKGDGQSKEYISINKKNLK